MVTVAQRLASLNDIQRREYINSLDEQELYTLMYDWSMWARPDQLTPAGDWAVWLILAGRGWGKTRTSAEDVKRYGLDHPKSRIAIVAPTYSDARDTCIEGESGLLHLLPEDKISTWNRSLGELVLTNGTRYKLFSSDEPERLRGPQHHRAWCDELCAWKYPRETWDMLMFGLRLGHNPQVVVATTPKPIPVIRELLQRNDVILTRGSTFDNAQNLAPAALAQLKFRYSQTRIGQQELYAVLLEDSPGALWHRDNIEEHRVTSYPDLVRVVVGVDPAVADLSRKNESENEANAETGIICAGVASNGHAYVLDDKSIQASPHVWASEVIATYKKFRADRVIGEQNNGGILVESTIRTIDRGISYSPVWASRGKYTRAEPVAALYEQGKVHHVGLFADLESQMCQWEPLTGMKSPDRLDALVWALTELMLPAELPPDYHLDVLKQRVKLMQQRSGGRMPSL